jgi:mono/diheme cytochrome c family protein
MPAAMKAATLTIAVAVLALTAAGATAPAVDRHTRPRALAFDPTLRVLYVALSTADEIAIVDAGDAPKLLARRKVCRFPGAVVAKPGGGAIVACRFDSGLRVIEREGRDGWRVRVVDAGPESGARGLTIDPSGRVAYVASPSTGGVKVVSIAGAGVLQSVATGISPRAMRVVEIAGRALLLVSNFIEHAVTAHPIAADGRLGDVVQTIRTEAPVLDLTVVGEGHGRELLLLTHEDRPVNRANGPVEGLDSVVLRLAVKLGAVPFDDPGPGRRRAINLGERRAPVIELAAAAGEGGRIAIVGAGSDNLLVADGVEAMAAAPAVAVGANPSAVAALPGGRFVTADRLSDSLSFVGDGRVIATLVIGNPERQSPAERGELMFFSRALTPHNVADGPLSLYTCAACHDDGHVDGRRHPAKRNRFFSMTESCRGIGTTAPYLNLGDPETIDAFADNIVATHAQGAERNATGYDKYPVELRIGPERVELSPAEVRAALAAYMAVIPPEPSPYVAFSRRALDRRERRGLAVFRDGCSGCHQLVGDSARGDRIAPADLERKLLTGQVALTSPRRYAVGTPVLGEGGNNPPSLRGVWDAAPYFSDGSARSLDDVLRRTDPEAPTVHAPENATRPPAFSADERAALLAFPRAL